jgi:hypothetical protein
LEADGIEVSDFEPRKLTPQDADQARLLVAIGVDFAGLGRVGVGAVVEWSDFPGASVDNDASTAAMIIYIDELLDNLEKRASRK